MQTITRIRKVYQPLNISISVKTEGVSLAQVVNQFEGTTSPERKDNDSSRTILRPYVYAGTGTNDPSWEDGNYAKSLTEVKWLANGVDISVSGTPEYEAFHKAGSALFSIVQSEDETNGSLLLWKNCAAEEHYAMTMYAKILDSRTGKYYEIRTDAVDLTATALGEDEWDFSIVHDVNIQYNPLLDRLKLYDWLKAHGQTVNKADYLDATAYDITLPILITKGHDRYTADDHITFELQDHTDGHKSLADAAWLTEFDKTHLRIDQRKLPHKTLVVDVIMKVDGNVQSQEQLTFSRVLPHVQVMTSNNSNIDMASATRWERAVVMFDSKKVAYPEAYLAIKWGARSSLADQWTEQGYGEEVSINQSALNVKTGGKDKLYVQAKCYMKTGITPLSNTDVIKATDNTDIVVASITSDKNEVYMPLSIVSYVTPSGKPLVQTIGDASAQRTESNPLVLTPVVIANSSVSDPTWTDGNCNAKLTDIKWLANGKDISTITDFNGKYSITKAANSANGTLNLWHNCTGYEMHDLQMQALLTDARTGHKYVILTEPITIMGQTPAESEWDFSVVHDVNIMYSPVLDRLKEYDWLVAQGKIDDTTANRQEYTDATGYRLHLPLLISHGYNKVTPDDTITFRIINHASGERLTPDSSFLVTAITNTAIDLDLRYMGEDNLVLDVQMWVGRDCQSIEQLTLSRYYPRIDILTTNKSNIDLGSVTRWDKALVLFDGKPVSHPEAFLRLSWSARADEALAWIYQGMGEEVDIKQSELTNLTDNLYVRIDYRIKSGLAPLSNADGYLIENINGQKLVVETLKGD